MTLTPRQILVVHIAQVSASKHQDPAAGALKAVKAAENPPRRTDFEALSAQA